MRSRATSTRSKLEDVKSRSQGRKTDRKSDIHREKEEKFLNHIESRLQRWRDTIDKSSKISKEEAAQIHRELDEYYQMELQLIDARAQIVRDFENLPKDKNERRRYLDEKRLAREARRVEDDKVREIVIEKRRLFEEKARSLSDEL